MSADPRAWARRILDREADGDPTLPYIARVFAREALNLPPLEVTKTSDSNALRNPPTDIAYVND